MQQQVATMTTDEIKVAVAELRGWRVEAEQSHGDTYCRVYNPGGIPELPYSTQAKLEYLPDYPNDANGKWRE